MKKSLLIAIAALFVAIGANAQAKRVAQSTKKMEIPANVKLEKVSKTVASVEAPVAAKKKATRRAGSVAGTYIMESTNRYEDFTENAEFTIEEATGTTNVGEFDATDELVFTREFEYNVKLTGFSSTNAVAYGYYDAEEGYLLIPMQVIGNNTTYGEIVMSGSVRNEKGGINYGSDIVLLQDEDGNFEFDEEYATGWFSFLPNYETQPGATWNYGFECEVFYPNANMGDVECHIVSGAWGAWANAEYNVYVEDYGSEIVVHNFFGLCPISVTLDGDKASIMTPVQVMDYDYADEGEDPDYIMINQWDANFENILNPGAITGNVTILADGTKVIEFYDTEYREAWTDEYGDHEAGNYIITDYTKWFMVHSTWGEQGAYWWGEARNVYIVIPATPTAINNVNVDSKNGVVKLYDLQGRAVDSNYKGIVISNGKKYMNK